MAQRPGAGHADPAGDPGAHPGPGRQRSAGHAGDAGLAPHHREAGGAGGHPHRRRRHRRLRHRRPVHLGGGGHRQAARHHPRFNSGTTHGNTPEVGPLWNDLYASGAELVVNGHEHVYERFAPQRPDATADNAFGIREIIAGTGGNSLYQFGSPQPNSQVRNATTNGVLKLTLRADGYDFNFIPVAGKTFTDSGSGTCHDRP